MTDFVRSRDPDGQGEMDKQSSTAVVISDSPVPETSLESRRKQLTIRMGSSASVPSSPLQQSQSLSLQDGASILARIRRLCAFLGPGAIISVAYIDPDNYQTAISSGGSFQYKLLFMVLVSNLIAIYLQALCVKLGTVTGLDLAQLNHRHLPRWLDLIIYAIAEACIICTDLGQVIGTAISLNILIPKLPLSAACCISVVETLLILLFYKPNGELRRIRLFEVFIAILVVAVFVTICLLLARISAPAGPVFKGFLPSRDIFVGEGLYESCALLGGSRLEALGCCNPFPDKLLPYIPTDNMSLPALMPHTIYLGTALSRSRLYNFDEKHNLINPSASSESLYRPSLRAIRSCLSYSVAELCITLGTVAVFANSALVIISGAAFYGPGSDDPSDNIYSLHDLFSSVIAPAAGTLFAVSLLFSGVSAGIVATMAGQVVMEGALQVRMSPFVRRLATRCVAIIPALIVAVSMGQEGLSQALVACNYILAIGLIFVTFPLVYYTSTAKYMTVPTDEGIGLVSMNNNVLTATVAYLIWAVVVFMDLATVVLVGMGVEDD